MRLLLVNDDGIHAEGLRVLAKILSQVAEVWVVAPLEEWSTCGHALTLHKPLRWVEFQPRWVGVSGSPADCVYLGVRRLFNKRLPDWVISGINRGANLGQDIYSSGTVAGAREACLTGLPAISVSLAIQSGLSGRALKKKSALVSPHYEAAARLVKDLLRRPLSQEAKAALTQKKIFLNLNVPDRPSSQLRGVRWTIQGAKKYRRVVLKRQDYRGQDYFWIGGLDRGLRADEEAEGTETWAVASGFAALTLLQIDATAVSGQDRLRGWLRP